MSSNLPAWAVARFINSLPTLPGFLPVVPASFSEFGDTLPKAYSAAYPIIYETDLDDYEYAISGTGFFLRFRGRLFFVTAQHCVAGISGNEIRLACNVKTKAFLPLRKLHLAETDSPDSDFSDLALMEAEPTLLSQEEQRDLHWLDMDALAGGWRAMDEKTDLFSPGFPKELNFVDYEARKIVEQRCVPGGVYGGPLSDQHMHVLRYAELDHVGSIDGMSGSPVIMMKQIGGWYRYTLAGVLIRGTKESMTGRFIDAGVVLHALETITRQRA